MLTDPRGLTPAAAGLCFIPGVGWVGCGVAAVGAGAICFITGACQAAIQGIGDAIQQMCADDDEGEIDCEEWLDTLNAQWALISIQSPGPFENLGEKNAHNASVDLFCASCPDLCDQARRFTTVTIQ